jgi:hypothetical protein
LRIEELLVISGEWITGLVKLRLSLSVVTGLRERIAGERSSVQGNNVSSQGRIRGQQAGQLLAIDNDALGSLLTDAIRLFYSGIGRVTVAMMMMMVMTSARVSTARITSILSVLRISAIVVLGVTT